MSDFPVFIFVLLLTHTVDAVLPVLISMNVQVVSAEITETKMYLKVVHNRITRDIPSGRKMGDASHEFFDTVSPAMVISNSEVGCGSLSVETAVWTKVCTNLAISSQRSMRKYHVGPRADLGAQMFKLLSDDTKKKTDIALWAQVRDVVKNAFDQAQFDSLVNDIQGLAAQPIEGDPVKVVDVTSKLLGLQEVERIGVLRHLIEGGDLSRYGLFNAITRTAEDVVSYDRATELERFGGQLIEMPSHEWKQIGAAA